MLYQLSPQRSQDFLCLEHSSSQSPHGFLPSLRSVLRCCLSGALVHSLYNPTPLPLTPSNCLQCLNPLLEQPLPLARAFLLSSLLYPQCLEQGLVRHWSLGSAY